MSRSAAWFNIEIGSAIFVLLLVAGGGPVEALIVGTILLCAGAVGLIRGARDRGVEDLEVGRVRR